MDVILRGEAQIDAADRANGVYLFKGGDILNGRFFLAANFSIIDDIVVCNGHILLCPCVSIRPGVLAKPN